VTSEKNKFTARKIANLDLLRKNAAPGAIPELGFQVYFWFLHEEITRHCPFPSNAAPFTYRLYQIIRAQFTR
jgi:hypothetical protein